MSALVNELQNILGPEHVITDEAERIYYSQDVYSAAPHVSEAIIRPQNIDDLAQAIGHLTAQGYAVFPRGGGVSYTSGYHPSQDKAVSVDMAHMNKILEINLEDMYVTVEAGCRWVDLHEALKDKGVRPPMWGTLSGITATIGGGLSQNSIFFGTGLYGSAADSVVGLKVVLADGRILETGSGAVDGGQAFFRHYGPDLTGLFTGDTGALGIKAEVTLKLIPAAPVKRFASFNFSTYDAMFKTMQDVSRAGLASECFGFDPFLQQQRMKRESLAKDVKSLAGVMKASGSVLGAIKDGAKLALAGRGYMDDVQYSCHLIHENRHEGAADVALEEMQKIAAANGGEEIENSIPKIISANPFTPLNNMIGPDGERWLPVHAVMPHSKAKGVMDAVEALFESHKADLDRLTIETGYLIATIGASATLIEPVFFWPEQLLPFHERQVDDSVLNRIKGFDENPEATAMVKQLRGEVTKLFLDHGCTHFQIGRTYRYAEGLKQNSFDLVKALKQELDPKGLMNPGSLGL